MHPLFVRASALGLVTVLAACASREIQVPMAEAPPPPPPRDLLAEVRSVAVDAGDVSEVLSLRDPGIEDLLRIAENAEREGDWERAEAALEAALAINPDNPETIQWRAEILLAQRRLEEAEQLAWQSFERGPRLGHLCRRNWATLRLAREERGDAPGAASAAQQFDRCLVQPPVRM